MAAKLVRRYLIINVLIMIGTGILAQDNVPLGIHYQAVARDNYGKEMVNKKISVRFSIISDDPLSAPVFQELHANILTSRFGVFSLVIGHGITTGKAQFTKLSEIAWEKANHYLKVEVQFENENDFMDMGTMQFLTVPYALYAQRSLEPGPAGPRGDPGPKGDPGDPASDKQTLSVVNVEGSDYLAISGGNQVKISTIEKDGDPINEIQDLIISSDKLKITKNASATEWDLTRYLDNTDSQALTWNSGTRSLGISGNTGTIDLSELKNDADANPTNEIQSLNLTGDVLSISGSNNVNLSAYKDNTDNQTLSYSESATQKTLSISGGNQVTIDNMVAFRVKNSSSDISTIAAYPVMTYDVVDYNVGNYLNASNGIFTAPVDGIYTFNVSYYADGSGDGRELAIYVNTVLYEKLAINIGSGSTIPVKSITIKLSASNTVSVVVYTGLASQTGTGSFSGYKVN